MQRHCFFAVFFLFSTILLADEGKKDYAFSDFLRVSSSDGAMRDGQPRQVPVSYDTAIVKFADEKSNVEVHLIGAIHIGDKEYYEELNEIFKRYDAVLYELVAEENTRPHVESGRNESQSILSSFQSGLGNALALNFQLSHIDYHVPNMIHADLSPSEFARHVSERGDIMQLLSRLMMQSVRKSGSEGQQSDMRTSGRLLGSFLAVDPQLSLKRVLAQEMMNQLDETGWVIGGDGSAIITDRNNAALRVLRREIDNGKKKIAIFYGAAHLPEFARSLERDFGMTKTGVDWVIAWDLTRDRSARR